MRESDSSHGMVDEELRRKYERAWNQSVPPKLEDFAPAPDSPRRIDTLAELVCIEIEKLWTQHAKDGTSPQKSIESYLRQFPELRAPETTKQLIEQELLMQKQSGRAVDVTRYSEQYPDAFGLVDTEYFDGKELGRTTFSSSETTPPTSLGNYELQDCIGSGGMGRVYLARHKRLRTLAAVKVVQKSLASIREVQLRFQREGRAAAQLRHENIATAFDAGEDGEWNFIVFEYVEGENLQQMVERQGPLPLAQAVDFVCQAARGLAAAHLQGFVHRDVKPANLMVDQNGVVKVLDLGLASTLADEEASQLTKSDTLMGTLDFMAPEQGLDPTQVDARADIYSLGCTLYFLVTGKRLYEGPTTMARLVAHRERPIPNLVPASGETCVGLQKIYRKMVAKQPDDRYSSMDEVIRSLAVADDQPKRKVNWIAVTVIVILLGLASLLAYSGLPIPPPGDRVTSSNAVSQGQQLLALGATLYINADGQVTKVVAPGDLPEGPIEIVGLEAPPNISEDELLQAMKGVDLQELYLENFALTTHGLERIMSATPRLFRLHLGGTDVSGVDLSSLRQLKSLHTLWIGRTSLKDEQMKVLGDLDSLGYLWMGGNPISDDGVRALSSLRNLRGLGIEQTLVSGNCLEHLETLSLQALVLDGNDFDDQDVNSLARLTSLESLSLLDTKISEEGLRQIQAALPNCDVD